MNTEQEVNAVFGAIAGGRMLDVATGFGSTIAQLAQSLKSFAEITGIDTIDLSTRFPAENIFKQEKAHFQVMDAQQMEFADASFDTVVIGNSLHHMADARRVLQEMWRVLKPDGHFIVVEMYRDNQTEAQMTHVLMHHWWAEIDRAKGVVHNETYARSELVALLEAIPLRDLTLLDQADLERDPQDAETRQFLLERLDYTLKPMEGRPDYAAQQAKAETLRQRLNEFGFHSATSLIAVGRK